MKKARISFFTNVEKTQIIDNGKYFDLRGVPVTKDGAVMNGLLYPKEENEIGMPSLIGKVVTLSHPKNSQGGIDAYEGDAIMEFFSGGVVRNVYLENGIRKADIRISKAKLKAADSDSGTDFYNRLQNREPIAVSTGLYTLVEEIQGTNAEGVAYAGIAKSQKYNHLAMLEASEPPAGGDDTYMRFNNDDDIDKIVINLAQYLNTVDYMPESTYTKEDEEPEKKVSDEKGLILKLLQVLGIGALFANKIEPNYNIKETKNLNEGQLMPNAAKMREALENAGKYKEGMTDEEIASAYEKLSANNEQVIMQKFSELENTVKAQNDEIALLKSKINEQQSNERSEMIADLELKDIGLDKSDLDALEVNALKKLHLKHCGTANYLGRQAPRSNNESGYGEMPSMEI